MSACFSSSSSVSNNQHHALMLKAFSVVEPVNGDWRDPIRRVAHLATFQAVCAHYGVTLGDVLEAVEYFTATAATVSTDADGRTVITAPGYRAGPAGDH